MQDKFKLIQQIVYNIFVPAYRNTANEVRQVITANIICL